MGKASLLGLFALLPLASAGEDVLFYAPFDGSAVARIARGNPVPAVEGPLKFAEGKVGKALVCGEGGAFCQYEVEGNLLPRQGTVEMWVKPLDWDGRDEKFHAFFEAKGRGWLLLYKYYRPGVLLFLIGDDVRGRHWVCARHDISDWRPGEWHHLAATWREREARLFVDGELCSEVKRPPLPPDVGSHFLIGDRPWHIPRKARTLVDEVYIYRRALTPSEVRLHYLRASSNSPSERPLISLAPAGKPPKIDGRLEEGEWLEACSVTGFLTNVTGEVSRRQTVAFVARDGRFLYIAFVSPVKRKLRAEVREHDGPVWTDDAVEVFLDPTAGREKGAYYHLIVNSLGVRYDSLGRDNPEGWEPRPRISSRVEGGRWTVEIAIPWEDLGGRPKEGSVWGLNLCRDWQNPLEWTSWSHTLDFHKVENFGRLVFDPKAPFVHVRRLGFLSRGLVEVEAEVLSPLATTAEVGIFSEGRKVWGERRGVPPSRKPVGLRFERALERPGVYKVSLRVGPREGRPSFALAVPFTYYPPLRLFVTPDPARGVWDIEADILGLREEGRERARCELTVLGPRGERVWSGEIRRFVEDVGKVVMPKERSLKPGRYRVLGKLRGPRGEEWGEAQAEVVKPETPWRGLKLYKELTVLPPWTPMEVVADGTRAIVKCWGREYRFDGPFLTSITSRGEEILAGPIRLEALTGSGPVRWRGRGLEVVEKSDALVRLRGEAQGDGLRLEERARAEFDGMLWFELTLSPSSRSRLPSIEGLTLVIPFRRERAKYFHRYGRWKGKVSGALPRGEGKVMESEFIPFIWLGDEDRGLFWFAESDEGWAVREGEPAVEVVREGGRVLLQFHLVRPGGEPVSLDKPLAFAFGLQASPVKPLPKRWRRWRLLPGPRANVQILWTGPKWMKHFGYPEARDPSRFAEYVKRMHERGVKVVPYSLLLALSEASDEFKYFGRWWMKMPPRCDRGSSDVLAFKEGGICGVCPACEDYADFIVYKTKRFVESLGLDGLYHDWSGVIPCSNELHGCGYVKGRERRTTWPILATRDLYRRIYAMLKSQPRETFMMAHMSGHIWLPMLSFTDAWLDGEQFRPVLWSHPDWDYTNVLTLDQFRAEFMGRQWGAMRFFLPELAPEARGKVKPTRQLLSLTLLHDVPVWAIWCNAKVVFEARRVLDEFGYVDAEFLPYWANEGFVKSPDENVKVSIYRLPGRALLIASNFSSEDRKVALGVNLKALGLDGGAVALDAETGKEIPLHDGALALLVPAKDFRMIKLEAPKGGRQNPV